MNFYKDPLLEKLRLIESRIINEDLSDDEWVELQRLRAELADDPEASKLHADVDAVVKARGTSTTTTDNPTDPEKKKKKKGPYANPGTRAFQHWLNAHGEKVTIDGVYGPATKAAAAAHYEKIKDFNRPNHQAEFDEFQSMQGCGTAYNVRPTKTDTEGYMWIGSKTYLEAMKKYGYDPKTGNPVPGGPADKPAIKTPNQSDAETARLQRQNAGGGQAGMPTQPTPSGRGSATGPITVPPELTQAVPNPKSGDEYWIKGTRYEYTAGGRGGQPHWTITQRPGEFAFNGATRRASDLGYTGPGDMVAMNAGMANLDRAKNQAAPKAESTELDRLKQLLKF